MGEDDEWDEQKKKKKMEVNPIQGHPCVSNILPLVPTGIQFPAPVNVSIGLSLADHQPLYIL